MGASFKFDTSMAVSNGEHHLVPQLSFSSLRSRSVSYEPPGMKTPPVHGLVSVPFMWEEAPGKPRPCLVDETIVDEVSSPVLSDKEASRRGLDLPPRLFNETVAKDSSVRSPTTVLDGPYVRRSRSLSLSRVGWDKVMFGSARWRRGGGHPKKTGIDYAGGFDYLPFLGNSNEDGHDSSDDSSHGSSSHKIKISRTIGRSCFLPSTSKRNLWGSIVDSCKQAVPWKRKR